MFLVVKSRVSILRIRSWSGGSIRKNGVRPPTLARTAAETKGKPSRRASALNRRSPRTARTSSYPVSSQASVPS